MKKTKIKSVDEAVKIIEESSIIKGTATMNGDAKTNNKYVRVQNRALVYLYEHESLAALHPLLSHSDFNVRLYAAYALLPLFEDECRKVLLEIANGDRRTYEIQGFNAKMTLMMWDIGELHFPYQSDFGKKPSEESNKKIEEAFLSTTPHPTVGKAEEKGFPPEILRLSRIFGCSPANDTELQNENSGFYVELNRETQKLTVNINTFVNPYTQDVSSVYKERLSRLDFLKHIATIDAYEPSKLGAMQIKLTIPVADVTDEQLKRLRDVILQMHSEQVPNESFVWFKSEYNDDICYFEGNLWWYPRRAVIMGEDGYERFEFSDEEKFDRGMWDIVTGDYDQLENSDSFELISQTAFQTIWEQTEKVHEPEPWE